MEGNFLDNIPQRDKIKEIVTKALSIESEVIENFRQINNKYYYKKTKLPENQGKLYVREIGSNEEKVLFDPANYKSSGKLYDINTLNFSKDGKIILVDLFPLDGSEINDAVIINGETEKVIPDTLKKIYGWPSIVPDGSEILYDRANIENGKLINSDFTVCSHKIGSIAVK